MSRLGVSRWIALDFEPYASRIVVFRARSGDAPLRTTRSVVATTALRSPWSVHIGVPTRPAGGSESVATVTTDVSLPHSWADFPETRYYSGTATYRHRFEASPQSLSAGVRTYLDFGPAAAVNREALADGTMRGNSFAALVVPPVREAVTVFVNDRRAGTLWAPPYRIDITSHLRSGSNDIRLEVYNTAINALAEGGKVPDVRALNEQYGQRFRLQDMDAFTALPSGLLSVPRVVVER